MMFHLKKILQVQPDDITCGPPKGEDMVGQVRQCVDFQNASLISCQRLADILTTDINASHINPRAPAASIAICALSGRIASVQSI